VRIASFNVENLFQRARAFEAADSDAGREVLALQSQTNGILGQPAYSDADKREIVSLLGRLGLATSDDGSPFVILRQNRGRLLTRHVGGEIEVTAGGRDDWLGWVELKVGPVNALSTRHTAQVIKDLAPDVLATVEVEDRLTLKGFSDVLLPAVGGTPYGHVMVIDGNDDRGIDVGVLVRDGLDIVSMRSHVDDIDAKGEVFSRDCAEYLIEGPAGSRVRVLVNHLKSKGYGNPRDNDAKRRRQAVRVAQIYKAARKAGEEHVAVVGDFNDTPDSAPLRPLLSTTDLQDITESSHFAGDGRPGTFGNGTKSQKLDYILLSPKLFDAATGGGIFRKGVWGGKNGTLWEHYPDMTSTADAASDHAAIWADLDL
jgi:endonuclease/exonuclease/phosphatase family metal-dependent hydrolase